MFGYENKATDHTQQFISDEKQNSPNLFTRNHRDSLGEFSNASYFVFGAERGKTAEQKTKLSMACGKENILLNAGRLHSHVDITVLSGAK